jgi:predicted membrane-bound dolichyl-phosphate-mannose-protein mannosyltransferase
VVPADSGKTSVKLQARSKERPSHLAFVPRAWFAADKNALWADFLVIQLIIVTLLLRLLWLSNVPQSIIFDEPFYVGAAKVMLSWPIPEGQLYAGEPAGIDPNHGHMPLGKVMIAGSMVLLGDNPLAWRLSSILLGTLAIGVFYLLIRRLTGKPWVALFAAFLLSFDNLFFVHSRIATLDIPMTSLMLLGIYFYVTKKPVLAGAMLALAALTKINGGLALGALIGFEVLRLLLQKHQRSRIKEHGANMLIAAGTFTMVFLLALWAMDSRFTLYKTPFEHLSKDFSIGVQLRDNGVPQGIASEPWQWLQNEKAITYYFVNQDTIVDGKSVAQTPLVGFVGQMNPYLIMMWPLALGYLAYVTWRKRDELSPLMLALFGATWGQPLLFALLFDRTSYIFYMVPVLPAICAGIAYFLLDQQLPRIVPLLYCAAILFGFAMQFPFRTIPS